MRASILVLALVAGCSPHRIELSLVHSRALVPADSFERVTVRIREAEGGRVVHEGSVRRAGLDEATELFDADALVVGRSYVVEVVAEAPVVCRLGRAVGRSLPFVHEEDGYRVAAQVGCADELATTRGRPEVARAAHRLVTAADGEAVLVGGADRMRFMPGSDQPFGLEGLTPVVERYDPRTGRFVPAGLLVTPRAVPAVVALANGEVGITGGIGASTPFCESSTELSVGLSVAAGAPLAQHRCLGTAAFLPEAERVIVVGGVFDAAAADRQNDAELFDATMRERLDGTVRGVVYRGGAQVVPLSDGRSALVAGGTYEAAPGPVAAVVRTGGSCGEEACVEEVPSDEEFPEGLSSMAAAWVPCATGGGAVYVLGGLSGPQEEQTARDGVWCYRDLPGTTGTLVRAGTLPAPRSQAVAAAIRSPDGEGGRILVIGGSPEVEGMLPYDDALIVPVDGCTCAPVDPAAVEAIPLPVDGLQIMHDATVLPDGSVLLVGGLRLSDDHADATGEAALFVPDLAP